MTRTATGRTVAGRVAVLPARRWQALEREHHARVDGLLRGHLERASRGASHPVEDFLFTYYSHRPAQLRRWHPGLGVLLDGPEALERLGWRDYGHVTAMAATAHAAGHGHMAAEGRRAAGFEAPEQPHGPGGGTGTAGAVRGSAPRGMQPGDARGVGVDVDAFVRRRSDALRHVQRLLAATASRPAHLGCFGLHEWAMVYRQSPHDIRHNAWPLRLTPQETADVVAGSRVRCSHFDAFRFFTPAARPLNELQPTRGGHDLEQPGCLHANMNLYKWAYKLTPLLPSELVTECFVLARDIRVLDMRASPYDLSALGYSPVAIETAQGRAEYVAGQRGFAERAGPLRAAILAYVTVALDGVGSPAHEHHQFRGEICH